MASSISTSTWKVLILILVSFILLSTNIAEAKKKAPGGMGGMGAGGKYQIITYNG